jgi:hypothetical protein
VCVRGFYPNGKAEFTVTGQQWPHDEREELAKVIRLRAKALAAAAAQRKAELVADMESQLSAVYKADHEAWAEIAQRAQEAVDLADLEIARICRERGVRDEFRPELTLHWYGRGENVSKQRREELRKTGMARIDAAVTAAKTKIQLWESEWLTKVIAGGLESKEARAFLETVPSVEALMPPVSIAVLENNLQATNEPHNPHELDY